MTTIRKPHATDPQITGDGSIFFKFLTDGDKPLSIIKSIEAGGDGRMRVRLTASTTVRDHAGDIFTSKALGQMKEAAPGTTIFLNHKMMVPEDVFGMVEKAEVIRRKVAGEDVLFLDYDVVVDEANPRAKQTFQQIESGVQLGASVTVVVRRDDLQSNQGGGYTIDNLRYVEASVVGKPMNPLSMVQYARKALNSIDSDDSTDEASGAPDDHSSLLNENDRAVVSETRKSVTEETTAHTTASSAAASPSTVPELPTDAVTAEEFTPERIKAFFSQEVEKAKGLFNDTLAAKVPTPWELFDIVTTLVYRLARMRDASASAGVADDFDYPGTVTEIVNEYGQWLTKSLFAYLKIEAMDAGEISSYSLALKGGLEIVAKSIGAKHAAPDETTVATVEAIFNSSRTLLKACGRTVLEASPEASPELAEEVVKKSAPYVALEETLTETQKALLATEEDRDVWKAGAQTAKAALELIAREKLPRAGASPASA